MSRSLNLRSSQPAAQAARLAALLTLSHSAVDAVANMPSALLPTLQQRFSLTETGLALLVALLSFSSSVTQPLFGALADRISARWVLVGGSILTSVVLSLVGVAPSIALLALLFLVGGLGSAAYHPAGASLARAAAAEHRGLLVSLFGAGGTVGLAIGPLLVISVLATYGLGATPWLMLPGLLFAALLAAAAPQPPRSSGQRRAGVRGLRGLPKAVWVVALASIFESLAFLTFMNGMPLWLVAQGLPGDSALIGWVLASFALAAAGGGVLATALAGRLPLVGLVGGTMLLSLLPLFAMFSLAPGSAPFFAAIVLAGALMHAAFPILVLRAQDLAPEAVATASGMVMGFANGMAGLLYVGVGYLQQLVGIDRAMQLGFLALLPAALVAGAVVASTAPRPRARPEQQRGLQACSCTVCRCVGCVYAAG